MITRVQLGASRLENLDPKVLQVFLDKTWIHLGDPKVSKETLYRHAGIDFTKFLGLRSICNILRKSLKKVLVHGEKPRTEIKDSEELYRRTNFKEFYYRKGSILPFESSSLEFIFSEHFLEHLFFDEALSLMRECYRILKPFGVIRTCVPDADLRTYESPEPIGFPDVTLPYIDPTKHKIRWSVYSLADTLQIAGFEPIPLRYCDKLGQYIRHHPIDYKISYEHCPEQQMIFDLSYIKRINSLIVDGIKIR